MIVEIYEALIEAKVSEEKAKKAAQSVANFENRFGKIEAELMLLKWMVGFNLAFTMAMLWKIFS